MANANKLTLFIVVFMLMGILSGAAIHAYATPTTISAWADNITLLTDLFLRLIKMVIAPLVFSTLTVGIMRLGETATIGRVGGKAMVWFITSSVLSILVGLVIVTFQHPGAGHQKLHAGEHGLLYTVDGRAGDILARQGLQVFSAGRTGNYTHGHAPLF